MSDTKTISINGIWVSLRAVICKESWDHMWYMYTLLGIILILPFLKHVAEKLDDKKEIYFFLLIGGLFLSVIPMVEGVMGIEFGIDFPINEIYCFYMFIGYFIDSQKINLKKINEKILMVLLVLCCVYIVVFGYLVIVHDVVNSFISYNSPVVAVYSIVLFSLVYKRKITFSVRMEKLIDICGRCSFGVYILHMFWINIIYKVLNINPFEYNLVVSLFLLWVVTVVLSMVSVLICKKIPLFKQII